VSASARVACVLALGLAIAGCLSGCRSSAPEVWASTLEAPPPAPDAIGIDIPEQALEELVPLARVFYRNVTSRRFNSHATHEDPGLREFFRSLEAYSDYYANLVDALIRGHFEFERPDSAELLAIERVGPNRLRLRVRFYGEDNRPLRFWTVSMEREDEWAWDAGRWWIIPGKV